MEDEVDEAAVERGEEGTRERRDEPPGAGQPCQEQKGERGDRNGGEQTEGNDGADVPKSNAGASDDAPARRTPNDSRTLALKANDERPAVERSRPTRATMTTAGKSRSERPERSSTAAGKSSEERPATSSMSASRRSGAGQYEPEAPPEAGGGDREGSGEGGSGFGSPGSSSSSHDGSHGDLPRTGLAVGALGLTGLFLLLLGTVTRRRLAARDE